MIEFTKINLHKPGNKDRLKDHKTNQGLIRILEKILISLSNTSYL
jgi:hypothetical protein